jgi:hypothetical protein
MKRNNRLKLALVGLLLCSPASAYGYQDKSTQPTTTAESTELSEKALQLLVSGIAFYPDDVIADIFAVAQDMPTLHAAATGKMPQDASIELQRLARDPQILTQLDKYPATTARLALAARTQLADVWVAIDTVRQQYETAPEEETASQTAASATSATSSGTANVPVRPLARVNAFMAGLLADDVIDEISDASVVIQTTDGNTVAVVEGTAAAAVGENGVAGAVTVGDTTKFGAVAGGTTTTPNGSSVSAVGGVKGTATKTENGGSYSKDSAGVIVNNTTGEYAAGKRSTSGSVTTNADGSTSFSRSAATKTESSYGNTSVTRDSSGTVTGNGDGNYQSNTSIESSRGDATISTEAGNGEINTTVTTDNGTKEFSAGDGEVQNRPEDSSAEQSKQDKQNNSEKSGSRTSREQTETANRMLNESWSRLESHPKNETAQSGFQRGQAGGAAAAGQRATAGRGSIPNNIQPNNGAMRNNSQRPNPQPNMSGGRGGNTPSPGGRGGSRSGGRPGRGR